MFFAETFLFIPQTVQDPVENNFGRAKARLLLSPTTERLRDRVQLIGAIPSATILGSVHLLNHDMEMDLGPLTYTLPYSKNRRLGLTSRVRPMRRLLPMVPIGRTDVPSQRGPAAHRSTPS